MNISKEMKKQLEISFHIIVPKIMIVGYTVPEIWCVTDVIVNFYFRLFFALLPPYSPKSKISKKFQKQMETSSFYTSAPKTMIICYSVFEI